DAKLPTPSPRGESGSPGTTPLHDRTQRRPDLPRLVGADEARERLLDQLIWAEAEERGNRVVGLQDLTLEVGHEHGVRSVLDQALGVGPGLVQLPHVAQDADDADRATVGIAQGRG